MAKIYPFEANQFENYSYPVGPYRVFRLTMADPESMRYLSKLVIRALSFIDKYEAETDPVWLTQLLYNSLRNPQSANSVHALIAVNPTDEIVAHSIAYLDNFQKLGTVAVYLQFELSAPIESNHRNEIRQLGRELMEEWCRSVHVKTILAYTTDEATTRLHGRDGYKPFRIMLKKELGD